MREKVNLSIRMNPELHEKIKYISEYEGRSMSRQVIYLLHQCVRAFEQAHGPIETRDREERE